MGFGGWLQGKQCALSYKDRPVKEQSGEGRRRKHCSLTSTLKYCSVPQTVTHKIQSKVCKKNTPERCTKSNLLPVLKASKIIVNCASTDGRAPLRFLPLSQCPLPRFLSKKKSPRLGWELAGSPTLPGEEIGAGTRQPGRS